MLNGVWKWLVKIFVSISFVVKLTPEASFFFFPLVIFFGIFLIDVVTPYQSYAYFLIGLIFSYVSSYYWLSFVSSRRLVKSKNVKFLGKAESIYMVTVISSSDNSVPQGSKLELEASKGRLTLIDLNGNEKLSIPFDQINAVDIEGPGRQTTNAGLAGGGFGVQGALVGIAAATFLNAITTQSSINTFLRITTRENEIYLHSAKLEPLQLRNKLAPVYVALADRQSTSSVTSRTTLSTELAKLHDLQQSGVLTPDEFEKAKQKLLA